MDRLGLDLSQKHILEKIAGTIRVLSIEAVQKANSGHPGLPMGCAEIGAYLYGLLLRHCPKNPNWVNRDRFILSAGHGSMLLYSCLHLAGFDVSLEDIKNFRQLHSKTPGHPEFHETPGVETTTGPLGQGLGNAVGQALGLKILSQKFNTKEYTLFDGKVFVLVGDGCMMEGVTAEVSSLAGHLQLDNLIVFYDANNICLDGPLLECCSENTKLRYQSYGWDVLEIDGNDLNAIHGAVQKIKDNQSRPCLIIAKTIIGKGSPHKAGSSKAHGSPLGEEEVLATKKILGFPEDPFYIPQEVKEYFHKKRIQDAENETKWNRLFQSFGKAYPAKLKEWEALLDQELPLEIENTLKELVLEPSISGRKASQDVVSKLADLLPKLIGGSADLSCSDLTFLKKYPAIGPKNFAGRNIKFGVREFGMATMATGLSELGFFTPFIGTFLTFSDYMRNAIRLAALMKQKVIYQFTHDSIFLGEDGPTHQPIEHLAALRAIPYLQVIRPADGHEVKMAWLAALKYQGPTALILSRQNLPSLEETQVPFTQGMGRGAYLLKKEVKKPDYTLIATGSEVILALDVARELQKLDKDVRVVSIPCFEIFESQPRDYRFSILGGELGKRVSIEAGVEFGWHKYIGMDGVAISIETFGASAPQKTLAKEYGFTIESILDRIL